MPERPRSGGHGLGRRRLRQHRAYHVNGLRDGRLDGRLAADLSGQPVKLTADLYGSRIEYDGRVAGVECIRMALGEPDADGFRRVKLTTSRDGEFGEPLLAALLERGFRVRALSRENPTLEDVFLAATRRSWDARLPDKPVNGDSRAPLPKF